MAQTSLTGQDLVELAKARLLGYQNAIDDDVLLSYLNEGKDEVWAALKNLDTQYFVQMSQNTDSTQTNYFQPVNTSARQYMLPEDLKEIVHIFCLDSGFENQVFTYKKLVDRDWIDAYRDASSLPDSAPSIEYFYTIFGKDQILFAQFFQAGITNLQLQYVRGIVDFTIDDPVDEIVLPYTKKIADFAVKKATLGLKDVEAFNAWRTEWKDDLITIQSSAGPRNQADPEFVQDFLG